MSEGLADVLGEGRRLHVDASVLALHLAGDARYLASTRRLLGALADGETSATTSSLTVSICDTRCA